MVDTGSPKEQYSTMTLQRVDGEEYMSAGGRHHRYDKSTGIIADRKPILICPVHIFNGTASLLPL